MSRMHPKHSLPKEAIDVIDFYPEGSGEAGWVIHLKDGWSFDPGANDTTRFVPLDDPRESENFIAYKV